jgi:two-component system nitrogen regulation response regulator NtrX
MEKLMAHSWPGNVRELKNIIERLIILTPSNDIDVDDIPPLRVGREQDFSSPESFAAGDSLKDARLDFERQFIIKKLEEYDGNISRTAEAIGLERSNLHKKLKALKVVTKDDKQ